eukprot:GILI01006197.1.p1 GENE.GILI01006197.1~~GILI01006197.1.p1  ORF type:complete len:436 (-),score=108.39 GILI01006197.1:247-1554(-)
MKTRITDPPKTPVERATALLSKPPPSLLNIGQTIIQRGLWRPSALKVYSVDMGCSATKALASSMIGSTVLTGALGQELTAAATLTSAAQIQSLGLLALRIPLSAAGSVTGNGPAMTKFIALITEYAAKNASALAEISQMSAASQVATIGVKGSVIGAIATAAVQESIAVAYYCHGGGTFSTLQHRSVTIGMSAASAVGGGTVGAAVGCLVLPGVGAALGSLLGGYVGSLIPFYTRGDGYAHQQNEDPNHPSRKVKTVEVEPSTTRRFKGNAEDVGGGWLEVVDCSTESYFRFNEDVADGNGLPNSQMDSIAALRSVSQQRFQDEAIGSGSSSNAMCGFGQSGSTQPPTEQRSWTSFLNPSFYWSGGASSTSASPGPRTRDQSANSASFLIGDDVSKPGDNEVIIYFKPLDAAEEEELTSRLMSQQSFATCVSATN